MDNVNATNYAQTRQPGFIGDFLSREHVLAGGIRLDAGLFTSADALPVAASAVAAVDATTIAVAALGAKIPSGTVLDFGGKKFARLTADAAKGANTLTVAALAVALAVGDIARYAMPGQKKRIAAGTLVGATNAEIEGSNTITAGKPNGLQWGPAADADDQVRILCYDVIDADTKPEADVLRPGTLVRVNALPGWDTMSAALKTKVRATYEVTVAATEV